MPFGWGSLIGGALSGLGTLFGGMESSAAQAAANQANVGAQMSINDQQLRHARWQSDVQDQRIREAREFEDMWAREIMGFQERMSNTAYQRAMDDMRRGGLNPILAYKQGSASSPGGSMPSGGGSGSPVGAQLTAPRVEATPTAIGRGIANAVHSALDAGKTLEGIDLMKSQGGLVKEQERKVGYETKLLDANEGLVLANTEKAKADAVSAKHMANIKAQEEKDVKAYGSSYVPQTLERMLRTLQGAIQSDVGSISVQPKQW